MLDAACYALAAVFVALIYGFKRAAHHGLDLLPLLLRPATETERREAALQLVAALGFLALAVADAKAITHLWQLAGH